MAIISQVYFTSSKPAELCFVEFFNFFVTNSLKVKFNRYAFFSDILLEVSPTFLSFIFFQFLDSDHTINVLQKRYHMQTRTNTNVFINICRPFSNFCERLNFRIQNLLSSKVRWILIKAHNHYSFRSHIFFITSKLHRTCLIN